MIIYKCTNKINGDFYIGFTTISLEKRIKGHTRHLKNPKSKFHLALRKYGMENFIWQVIDNSAKSRKQLVDLEIKFIAELKPQYNMTPGGDGYRCILQSLETRQKRINTMRGQKYPPERCAAVSRGLKGIKFPNRKKPKPFSEEHRKNISIAGKLRKKNSSSTHCGSNL